MFENLHDITIQGGCFEEPTLLEGILNYPINILYGMNGMGKSSISRAFANYLNPSSPSDDNPLQLVLDAHASGKEKDNVFVFNEDFVDNNIRFSGDGLDSIVMIGVTIGLQSNIDELKQKKEKLQKKQDEITETLTGTDNHEGLLAKKKRLLATLKNNLSQDGAANHRRQLIKKMSRRTSISYDDICNAHTDGDNQAALLAEIQSGIQFIQNSSAESKVHWSCPQLTPLPISDINNVLTHSLRKAELSTDDEFILRIAADYQKVLHTKELVDGEVNRCPYCHQPISSDTFDGLRHFVETVLDEAQNKFQQKLQNVAQGLSLVAINMPQLPAEMTEQKDTVHNALTQYNNFIKSALAAIKTRQASPYESLDALSTSEYNTLYTNLNNALSALGQIIVDYNHDIDAIATKQRHLETLNLRLAYLENEQLLIDIDSMTQQITQANDDIEETRSVISDINVEIKAYETQLQQTGIAMDFINNCLQLVFADPNRLTLQATDDPGKYQLLSSGRVLSPSRISIGERNILALSYFFASIAQGKTIEDRYADPSLIVIDDPISSFDKGNRAGVFALMRREISSIIHSNRKNKLLIMSHDRSAIHAFKDIRNANYGYEAKKSFTIKQLVNKDGHKTITTFHQRSSDYAAMLSNIYKYAHSDDPSSPLFNSIGNQMRQVMETYANIVFNSDYPTLLEDASAWQTFRIEKLYTESREDYLQRRQEIIDYLIQHLSRSLLNSESHSTTAFDLTLNESYYTTEELHLLAKCILFYINGLTNHHLYNYLKSDYKALNLGVSLYTDLYNLCFGEQKK